MTDNAHFERRRWTAVATTLVVVAVLAASLAPAVAASSHDASEPTVSVGTVEATPGTNASVPVVLSAAPDGVAGYELTVTSTNDSVARIVGAEFPANASLTATEGPTANESSVTVRAVDLNESMEAGAENVTLATIQVRVEDPGTTTLAVEAVRIDDDSGETMTVATANGSVAAESSNVTATTPTTTATPQATTRASTTAAPTTDASTPSPTDVETPSTDDAVATTADAPTTTASADDSQSASFGTTPLVLVALGVAATLAVGTLVARRD